MSGTQGGPAAAGWYPDPSTPGQSRWWDGVAWTTHTAPTAPAAPAYGVSAPGYGQQYGGYGGYATAVAPRKVGFGEAISRAFHGWTDYSSRATIAEYWWYALFQFVLLLCVYLLLLIGVVAFAPSTTTTSSSTGESSTTMSGVGIAVLVIAGLVLLIGAIVLALVGLALSVRRLHDTDRSGWWYLISLVPFGSIVLIIFFISPGTPGPNQYGPVPQ